MFRILLAIIFFRWSLKLFAEFIILDLPVSTSITTVLVDSIF